MAKNTAVQQALPAGYVPALKTVYKEEIVPQLMKQFSLLVYFLFARAMLGI